MRPRQPGIPDRLQALASPAVEPEGETLRQNRCRFRRTDIGRTAAGSKACRLPVGDLGRIRDIHAKPGNHEVPRSLQQHTAELGLADHQIVRPFNLDVQIGQQSLDSRMGRYGTDQSQRMCGGVVWTKMNHGRDVEIARRARPCPPGSPSSPGLPFSPQPEPLGRAAPHQRDEIAVRGAGLRDDDDPARQKRAAAAAELALSRTGFRR